MLPALRLDILSTKQDNVKDKCLQEGVSVVGLFSFVGGAPGKIVCDASSFSTRCPPPSSHTFPWYGATQEQLKLPIWSVQLAPWRHGLGSHWFPSAQFDGYCLIVLINRFGGLDM